MEEIVINPTKEMVILGGNCSTCYEYAPDCQLIELRNSCRILLCTDCHSAILDAGDLNKRGVFK